MPGLD
jgi:hypothetical protein